MPESNNGSEHVIVQLHCKPGDLTNASGIIVQLILASLAFASLVVKRAWEPVATRRPWTIWFFDTSKQAAGAAVIHMLNVFLAELIHGDPCTWYVVSFLLDSTAGLIVIYVCIKLVTFLARVRRYPTLKFGQYGTPPSCRAWFHQCLAFIAITILEKIIVSLIMLFQFWRRVQEVILSPITNPRLEMIVVMLIIPFFTNVLMFWVVDSLIMQKGGLLIIGKQSKSSALLNKYGVDVEENEDDNCCAERLLDKTIVTQDTEGHALFFDSPINQMKHRNGSGSFD